MIKINYKLSLTIILTTFAHVVGFACYKFDIIPSDYQKVYFYNLDRVYLCLLLGITWFLHIDKRVKTALGCAFSIHLISSIVINIKYFINLNNETRENLWVIILSVSMLTCLISTYYVSRRQIFK